MRLVTAAIEVLRSPLAHKVTAVVFVSILLIEGIILIPSYDNQKHHLLQDLEHAEVQRALAILRNAPPSTVPEKIAFQVLQSDAVQGVTVFGSDGVIAQTGSPPATKTGGISIPHTVEDHLNVTLLPELTGTPYGMVLRLDARGVRAQLDAYVLRIAGLVLVITAVLTVATIVGMGVLVLHPLAKLRRAIDRDTLEFGPEQSRELERQDEIGVLFRTTAMMLEQLRSHKENLERTVAGPFSTMTATSSDIGEPERTSLPPSCRSANLNVKRRCWK